MHTLPGIGCTGSGTELIVELMFCVISSCTDVFIKIRVIELVILKLIHVQQGSANFLGSRAG